MYAQLTWAGGVFEQRSWRFYLCAEIAVSVDMQRALSVRGVPSTATPLLIVYAGGAAAGGAAALLCFFISLAGVTCLVVEYLMSGTRTVERLTTERNEDLRGRVCCSFKQRSRVHPIQLFIGSEVGVPVSFCCFQITVTAAKSFDFGLTPDLVFLHFQPLTSTFYPNYWPTVPQNLYHFLPNPRRRNVTNRKYQNLQEGKRNHQTSISRSRCNCSLALICTPS